MGPVPVVDGATGPVDSSGRAPTQVNAVAGTVDEVWQALVTVLDELEAPSSALLCSVDGLPVVAHGYCRVDLGPAARLTARMYVDRGGEAPSGAGAGDAVALTSGPTQTVIAPVPTGQMRHLLSVTADGVSMPILQAWTTYAAAELGELLAAQP